MELRLLSPLGYLVAPVSLQVSSREADGQGRDTQLGRSDPPLLPVKMRKGPQAKDCGAPRSWKRQGK